MPRRFRRLPFIPGRVAWLLPVLCLCAVARGQVAAQVSAQVSAQASAQVEMSNAAQSVSTEPVPRVPGLSALFRGFNAGVTFSQIHDSSAGWYNVVTPAVSYAISAHYSVDASASIYPYRQVSNPDPATEAANPLVTRLGEAGDTFIGLHAVFQPGAFRNVGTASFSIPTGDRSDGLGTGRMTFDFSDRLERYIKQAGLIVDVGGGDSSGLFNRLISREESSLGALAHFQAGAAFYLPWSIRAQSVAYEQLPLGHQTVYTTVSQPGAPGQRAISGNGVSEDNGITTSLAIPLTDNLILSSYYNRSLRQKLDTASVGVTWVLRGTPRRGKLSMIDKALREAERDEH